MRTGILICSLEMTAPQVLDKLIAKIGSVATSNMATGLTLEGDLSGVGKAFSALKNANLSIRDDLYDLNDILATARAMARSPSGLLLLLVDYIQLVQVDLGRGVSREREVAEVSRRLRLLALETGCVVYAITQLNEQGKARESRAIGQDATAVLIVKHTDDPEVKSIEVPIQRNGESGVFCSLNFDGRKSTFTAR